MTCRRTRPRHLACPGRPRRPRHPACLPMRARNAPAPRRRRTQQAGRRGRRAGSYPTSRPRATAVARVRRMPRVRWKPSSCVQRLQNTSVRSGWKGKLLQKRSSAADFSPAVASSGLASPRTTPITCGRKALGSRMSSGSKKRRRSTSATSSFCTGCTPSSRWCRNTSKSPAIAGVAPIQWTVKGLGFMPLPGRSSRRPSGIADPGPGDDDAGCTIPR